MDTIRSLGGVEFGGEHASSANRSIFGCSLGCILEHPMVVDRVPCPFVVL